MLATLYANPHFLPLFCPPLPPSCRLNLLLQMLTPPKASSVAGRTSAACWVPGCGRRRLQLGGCYSGRPGGANNPRPPHPCAVIAGLREAGTRYIRAAGPVMRPPKPVPSPADQERRSGMGPLSPSTPPESIPVMPLPASTNARDSRPAQFQLITFSMG